MSAMEYQGSSVSLAFLGHPILSFRRNQVSSMEGNSDQDDFELFQKNVADWFLNLFTSFDGGGGAKDVDNLLSIAYLLLPENRTCISVCGRSDFHKALSSDTSTINLSYTGRRRRSMEDLVDYSTISFDHGQKKRLFVDDIDTTT
ncbi:hypothetical protein NE237_004300 [Protea cynaroides]|uniref:Uncharacterized protein n=1 Tax=Protea cynaroides TaxID=273540 RepID=A0A9Q0KIQ8_9MAGN|nr:hypothetical protein NE237_004300 [Protea cynaroides]